MNQDIPVPTPYAGCFSIHGEVRGRVQFRQDRRRFCESELAIRPSVLSGGLEGV